MRRIERVNRLLKRAHPPLLLCAQLAFRFEPFHDLQRAHQILARRIAGLSQLEVGNDKIGLSLHIARVRARKPVGNRQAFPVVFKRPRAIPDRKQNIGYLIVAHRKVALPLSTIRVRARKRARPAR